MTVLIVDDDEHVVRGALRLLSKYKCGGALSLADGRMRCREEHPLVVVIDERAVRRRRGSSAARTFRRYCDGIQVVLWSESTTAAKAARAIGDGAFAVVKKGDAAELQRVVGDAVAYASARLAA